MAKKIKCPRCGQETEYSPANKARPFCSERCQLIDLGEWASEKYAVPAEKVSSIEATLEDENDEPAED
jgi:endogenous inhibitor of DNA gyrase (YacG/DUF329 family)